MTVRFRYIAVVGPCVALVRLGILFRIYSIPGGNELIASPGKDSVLLASYVLMRTYWPEALVVQALGVTDRSEAIPLMFAVTGVTSYLWTFALFWLVARVK